MQLGEDTGYTVTPVNPKLFEKDEDAELWSQSSESVPESSSTSKADDSQSQKSKLGREQRKQRQEV